MSNKNIVVFTDSVCRTIAGVKLSETETTVTVENPVIVNAMPNDKGQMSLQLIPVFFREILLDKNQDCTFEYPKGSITQTNITELDKQIEMQYALLFKPVPVELDTAETDGKVVDLFGDNKDGE